MTDPKSRGDIKKLGTCIDADPALRATWLRRAEARGLVVGDEIPGKKLVRLVLDRAEDAQVRTNPIARDEAFTCAHCGRDVPIGGKRPRDHCPWCLYSRHVDKVPGDRAETCGGLLVPLRLEPSKGSLDIIYRCQSCGASMRNRVLDDLAVPDDAAAVRALSGGEGPGLVLRNQFPK